MSNQILSFENHFQDSWRIGLWLDQYLLPHLDPVIERQVPVQMPRPAKGARNYDCQMMNYTSQMEVERNQ